MNTPEGFDYAGGFTPALPKAILHAGGRFVVRYIGTSAWKCMDATELAHLHDAGLSVGLVFESTGTTFKGGHAAGVADGTAARDAATALNVPAGTPIWFAIDTDTADYKTVNAYLAGAASVASPYAARLYAGYGPVQHAPGTGHWQTYAWSAGKLSAKAGLYQYHNGYPVGGADTDRCRLVNNELALRGGWVTFATATVTPSPAPTPPPKTGTSDRDYYVHLGNDNPAALRAIAHAKAQVGTVDASRHNMCLKWVRTQYGIGAGATTAAAAWHAIAVEHQHGWYHAPAGVPVFWTGGSAGAGHIAISDGAGNVWSTDINGAGTVALVPVGEIHAKWGLSYAGWGETLNGVAVYSEPVTPVAVPAPSTAVAPAVASVAVPGVTNQPSDTIAHGG